MELYKCVEFAKTRGRVYMDRNAHEMWGRMYKELSDTAPGIVGAVTSRGEAQMLRLALLFALLDCSEHITTDHLKAARAVWDYCELSARMVFGSTTREQMRLLQFLVGDPKSFAMIRKDLYKKNRLAEDIQKDLDRLISLNMVVEDKDSAGKLVFVSTIVK